MKNKFSNEYVAETKTVVVVKTAIEEFLKSYNISKKHKNDIFLSVDEAITNIIIHAYKKNTKKEKIFFHIEKKENKIIIILKDTGKPFDSSNIPKPNVQLNLAGKKRGGFGIHLMRTLMDKIEYQFNENFNQITLIKKI